MKKQISQELRARINFPYHILFLFKLHFWGLCSIEDSMLVPIVFPTGALAVHRYICITGYVSPGMMLTSHVTVKV